MREKQETVKKKVLAAQRIKIAPESVVSGRFAANEARKDRLELQGGDEAVFC
ncbi:hypothetical protein [Corynebacterium singulare]|uniref:hypothetical protein n=1 Tax=Corynebacterium singulare TaxID=161899 RepID=UPI001643563E|nr:hypothetical protein [Corynebacterium singulare]